MIVSWQRSRRGAAPAGPLPPSVFLEPNLAARADVLRRVAEDQGVGICTIYGDSFDDKVHDYVSMMRHNATELAKCLGEDA